MSNRYVIIRQTGLGKENLVVAEDDDKNKAANKLSASATGVPGVTFTMYQAVSETTYSPPKPSQGTFATKTFGGSE